MCSDAGLQSTVWTSSGTVKGLAKESAFPGTRYPDVGRPQSVRSTLISLTAYRSRVSSVAEHIVVIITR